MPGWHGAVKDLVADKKLVILGVTQEQHADRCRLFSQWQEFNWPILHDPINVLQSKAVPIVVAIDEQGIVRSTNPKPDWLRNEFLPQQYSEASTAPVASPPSITALRSVATTSNSSDAYRVLGDAITLWDLDDVDGAVGAYNTALQLDESSAVTHFRLGVALRRRHDSERRQPSDFVRAVKHWTHALSLAPNQYIWRRRIQQYGPRLDKPYPFYDWVEQANTEVVQRGETPIAIQVALSGAEIASPSRKFSEETSAEDVNPDPRDQINRDEAHYVQMNIAHVPTRIKAGTNLRLHLEFALTKNAVWNNEAEPLQVWIHPAEGWRPERALTQFDGVPGAAESNEVRRVELEFKSTKDAKDQSIRGFALYYICDKQSGTCLLRRQDFAFQAKID